MIKKLLIASNNNGKIVEIKDLLKDLDIQLLIPDDIQLDQDVEETGHTYLENARLKALAFCKASGYVSLADDTGLEVKALDGAPGLHSKRYSPDPEATDADRRKLLLKNLSAYPHPWEARFVCAVALAMPDGTLAEYQDNCNGEIIPHECGQNGFGYDRIFLFPELCKTMAELSLEEKNRISHRAKAVQGIIPYLKSL